MATNYLRTSLSLKSNEIVCYKPVSFAWIKKFKNDFLAKKEGSNVVLYEALEDHVSHDGFAFKQGDTLHFEETLTKATFRGSKPWSVPQAGEVPLRKVRVKERQNWSCEDVCEYIIKVSCMSIQSYYTDILLSTDASLVRPNDFDKGAFVSYARQMKFEDFVDALDNFFGSESDKSFVWVDLFCANQPKLTEKVEDKLMTKLKNDLLTKGLHQAISKFEKKVVVFDDWQMPSVIDRAWCIWEMLGVTVAGDTIDIALNRRQESLFWDSITTFGSADIVSVTQKLDIRKATCHNKEEEKMIMDAIAAFSSFSQVQETIVGQLREWQIRTGEKLLKKYRNSLNRDQTKFVSMLIVLGCLNVSQGLLKEGKKLYDEALVVVEPNNPHRPELLYLLAQIVDDDEPDDAIALLLDAIKTSPGNVNLHRRCLLELITRYTQEKSYEDAEKCALAALELARRDSDDKPGLIEALRCVGWFYVTRKRQAEARTYFREAYKLIEPIKSSNISNYIHLLNELAFAVLEENEAEAKALGKEAIELAEIVYGVDHPAASQLRTNWSKGEWLRVLKGNLNDIMNDAKNVVTGLRQAVTDLMNT